MSLLTPHLSLTLRPFLHATPLPKLSSPSPQSPPQPHVLPIRAVRKMQGRVVCTASDKTVSVQVVRLAPHPKYKRRVRKLKKYQAHDPDNQFKVGDFVQLERSRPISKTKTFVAVAVAARNAPRAVEEVPKELMEIPGGADASSE